MKYEPGDILNLKMELDIHITKNIEFEEDELKMFIELCIRYFTNDQSLAHEIRDSKSGNQN